MIDVIKASNPHTVCFSSEDFETHLRNPKALARLMEIADQLNAKPVFLVYLRNQVEYLESLYLQFLRMGLGLDASDVIDQVVETGQFAWRKWVIQFDYAAMIDALIATNSNVMVRNYHALESNCIIQDFLTCIDQPADLKSNAESKRLNSARLSGNLQRFVTNREGNLDVQAIADIDNKLSGLRPRLSQNAQQRLKDRFWAGNQDIEAKFGVSLNQRFGRTASTNPVPVIDRLFATDTIDFLSRFFGMNNPAAAQTRGIDLPEDWLAAV
ncbi:hypothetical protein [Aestuariivita boseongensis]|uniref:hypothetical protein n=1 Tax=Aestuariivita boseongensis TaxID=1470562 RepID=UPI000680CF4A|nr:hypothetical protein [Aestuariivita boseongensis]